VCVCVGSESSETRNGTAHNFFGINAAQKTCCAEIRALHAHTFVRPLREKKNARAPVRCSRRRYRRRRRAERDKIRTKSAGGLITRRARAHGY